jgi:hypothetical protein
VEVDEEADWDRCEAEVRDDLSFVDREELIDCLEFENELPFDNEVETVGRSEFDTFVLHRNRLFVFERQATQKEFLR